MGLVGNREVIELDSILSYEFHKTFRCVSYDVNLKGAFALEEIDRRLEYARKNFRNRSTWKMKKIDRFKSKPNFFL